MINDHLYEGRYTPTNAYGKRESHNIYAKTREECEEKLAEMIKEIKTENAGTFAEKLMEHVMLFTGGHAPDDMTIVVSGIWEK